MQRIPRPDPGNLERIDYFWPDPSINLFVEAEFLSENSRLYNSDHLHLTSASLGFLWTTAANRRQMKAVAGQAEIPNFRVGAWAKARQEQQLIEWFGNVPDFVITFDAAYVADCSDVQFLALLEHELYHCGQAVDLFGFPKFSTQTGMPIFAMRGHDVEEFTGVVRRYGLRALPADTRDFVDSAFEIPEIDAVAISQLCGAC